MRHRVIDLEIEELVLHGFPARDRGRVRAAVEQELARLLGEPGAVDALGGRSALARADGGAIRARPGEAGGRVGAEVARAVVRGLAASPGAAGGSRR
jgi:hypothetical protein